MKIYSVVPDFENVRLDKWFKKNICHVPQSLIEKNIRKGNIKVNNKKKRSSYKVRINDKISIFGFHPIVRKNNKIKYQSNKKEIESTSKFVIENNENFIIINKPAGISVQSGTKSNRNILDILSKTKYFTNAQPYAVHRIDKETTGLLIVAKNRKYAQLFTTLFRIRKIHKVYLGISLGEFDKKTGILDDDLLYFEGKKKIISKAKTFFKVLDSNKNYTFLELKPITGRKHQLRKQLLLHNHPILGDDKYRISYTRKYKKNNLMLHAYRIEFSIDNKKYKYIAEPTSQFKNILKEKYLKFF